MSYDGQPEPTAEEEQEYHTAQNAKPGVLRIEGLTRADVHATILGVLRGDYDLHEQINSAIREAVEEGVSERVKELTDERLALIVTEVLAEGWEVTDSYGRKTGTTRHVKDFILEYINDRDDYRNPLKRRFREAIDSELKSELGKLLEEVKTRLRKMIDKEIAAKLRGALTEALKP